MAFLSLSAMNVLSHPSGRSSVLLDVSATAFTERVLWWSREVRLTDRCVYVCVGGGEAGRET